MLRAFGRLLKSDAAGGVVLVIATVLALLFANTALSSLYQQLLNVPVSVQIADFSIDKPLLLWINDGLMVLFFFIVGLELKREVLEGELNALPKIALPAFGAVGGMLVPALVFVLINREDHHALSGWAIPTATDIAFALGILSLLGRRVPVSLKVFLVSLAIFDDIGAILIIALFYTTDLSTTALLIAGICCLLLFVVNRCRFMGVVPYALLGILMWAALLKSGVHATLAGVLIALFIPLKNPRNPEHSPARNLEHDLYPVVAFVTLPLFAFFNAGVPVLGLGLNDLIDPVPLGITLGLFLGKQAGILLFCALGVWLGLASLPRNIRWSQLYGAALLCGIGFTMSLFIGALAYHGADETRVFNERLGILLGSLASALAGWWVLNRTLPATPPPNG